MTIMQGDSYPIYMELKVDGKCLIPDMISEMEVCIGESILKYYSKGEVVFEEGTNQWYIHPTQKETLSLAPGVYKATARPRWKNSEKELVIGARVGEIHVLENSSKAVI